MYHRYGEAISCTAHGTIFIVMHVDSLYVFPLSLSLSLSLSLIGARAHTHTYPPPIPLLQEVLAVLENRLVQLIPGKMEMKKPHEYDTYYPHFIFTGKESIDLSKD